MTETPLWRPGSVPAETSSFIGRSRECGEVAALLQRSRVVTLTGLAGVGKTRIALRVARDARDSFPDGVWVVELAPEQHGDLVAHDVAAVLGLREQSMRPQIEVLAEFLQDRRMLLVLDTCEHLLDACAHLVDRLTAEAEHLMVLATSRQPLGAAGERVVVVEPLPVPEPGDTDPVGNDAVRLFAERARALVPGVALDLNVVSRLCRRLEGIPLAIELAARRVRALAVEQIADRLDDRFALLAGGSRTPLGRHQTLRAAVGWSHELCTPDERLLWARLTVFAGSFDAESAATVCGDEWVDEVHGLLARLADKSLLVEGDGRFRMLGTVRDYGREWLRRLGEEDMMFRRHSEHYLSLVRRADAEWYGPDQLTWAAWARAELPNLRIALTSSIDEPAGLELAGLLWFVWACLGEFREGRYFLDQAIKFNQEPGIARARALWVRGWIAFSQGDYGMKAQSEEALAIALDYDDCVQAGFAAQTVAVFSICSGELDSVPGMLTRSAEYFDRAGRPSVGLAVTEAVWAMLFNLQGRFDEATEVLQRQWTRCVERGELWARAYGDQMRSQAELGRGEIDAAEVYARAALDVKWRLGDAKGSAMAMDQLAAVAAAGEEAELAACLLGAAERMWNTFGLPAFSSPEFAGPRDVTESLARAVVGDEAFDEAFRHGRTVPPDRAVECIREGKSLREAGSG
ncbi:ATP-binding protein [Sinosporangium siamense]|uniref:ATP-binding protein n=1 Tax=Sinosporangium siamense TaxID=1367973 RepID=UPI00194E302A|nr:AAA family ATPase [Sinosporangium siamense]